MGDKEWHMLHHTPKEKEEINETGYKYMRWENCADLLYILYVCVLMYVCTHIKIHTCTFFIYIKLNKFYLHKFTIYI